MFQLSLSQACQWLLTAGVSVKDRRYITALVTRQSWYRNLFLAFKLYNWTRTSPIYPIIIHSSVHVPLLCSYAKNFLSKRKKEARPNNTSAVYWQWFHILYIQVHDNISQPTRMMPACPSSHHMYYVISITHWSPSKINVTLSSICFTSVILLNLRALFCHHWQLNN